MTTMASLRKERQKRKQLNLALAKWKVWAKQNGLAPTSVKSGVRQVEAAKYPGRTVNAVIREFASRPAAPVPEPEHIDYSDRTEKLANAYRNIAPAMQEADLKSEAVIVSKAPQPRLPTTYNPNTTFEPVPSFLRRTKGNS